MRRLWARGVASVCACSVMALAAAPRTNVTTAPAVDVYRLKAADGATLIEQGSGLHYGRLGEREGLWLVCDRNGGASGNRVHFIARQRMREVKPGGDVVVSESIAIAAPAEGWDAFARTHATIDAEVLAELRRQVESTASRDGPMPDLEAITIGRGLDAPADDRLFVIAEQPTCVVLELRLEERSGRTRAVVADAFAYKEAEEDRGGDFNDGLEGIAWARRPGEFYVCEEGTQAHSASDSMHYWAKPRLTRCTLKDGRVVVDEAWSREVTQAVWALRTGRTHTLNALMLLDERTLAAVDRNGALVIAVDVTTRRARVWFNLYDAKGLDLREKLKAFPGPRRMPYVSIEGIARDAGGGIWMVDDPAMPETFHNSCLIRVGSATATTRTGG